MAQNRLLSAKWLYWLVIGGLLAVLTLSAMLAPLAHATTINVTTLADELNQNGNCSLREAIRAANLDMSVDACPSGQGADSISLAPGIYRLGIDGRDEDAGTTGDLDVAADLMITGALSSTTVIDGGALDRVIDSLSGAHVAISNVTLQNGTPGLGADGGGVRNAGALTLVDTIVAGNSAEDFAGGGIHSSGMLTITGSIIRNNTAGNGGGINNEGVVHVLGSLVNQNTGGGIATAGAATVANTILSENVGASSGGGIANLQGTLIVASSAIISNTAEFGGGLRNSGTLSVTHTLIQGNSGEIGGGVTNESSVGASLSASTISGNVGSGIQNFSALSVSDSVVDTNTGSGLFNDTSGELTVTASTISNNLESGANNRGLLILTSSALISNTAVMDGGGLTNSGTLTITNSTISGNRAPENGGGIANTGPKVVLHNTTVAHNSANSLGVGLGEGGGIYNAGDGDFALANTIVATNTTGLSSSQGPVHPDCFGTFRSLGYNLIGDLGGLQCVGFANGVVGDLVGNSAAGGVLNPLLGQLSNTGPTPIHPLLVGSPAIDAGNPVQPGADPAACAITDQRGIARPQGARCDIGAYEWTTPPTIRKAFVPTTIVRGGTATIVFTITNELQSDPITGITFADTFSTSLRLADQPDIRNTCGGTVLAEAGGSTISLLGGSLAQAAACTITVVVVGNDSGDIANTTDPVTADQTAPGSPSNTAHLMVNNPLPQISALAPEAVRAGGTGFTLVVTGTNFVPGAIVRWQGFDRPTTYISSTQLVADITASDIAAPGTVPITVFNPAPGGGTSNTKIFTIQQPSGIPEKHLIFVPLILRTT